MILFSAMEELRKTKCQSLKQKSMVFQLSKELELVRNVSKLSIHYLDEFGVAYILENQPDSNEVYVPIRVDEEISTNKIAVIQKVINEHHRISKFMLAIMDAESTTVFFTITPGLLPPSDTFSETVKQHI